MRRVCRDVDGEAAAEGALGRNESRPYTSCGGFGRKGEGRVRFIFSGEEKIDYREVWREERRSHPRLHVIWGRGGVGKRRGAGGTG